MHGRCADGISYGYLPPGIAYSVWRLRLTEDPARETVAARRDRREHDRTVVVLARRKVARDRVKHQLVERQQPYLSTAKAQHVPSRTAQTRSTKCAAPIHARTHRAVRCGPSESAVGQPIADCGFDRFRAFAFAHTRQDDFGAHELGQARREDLVAARRRASALRFEPC